MFRMMLSPSQLHVTPYGGLLYKHPYPVPATRRDDEVLGLRLLRDRPSHLGLIPAVAPVVPRMILVEHAKYSRVIRLRA